MNRRTLIVSSASIFVAGCSDVKTEMDIELVEEEIFEKINSIRRERRLMDLGRDRALRVEAQAHSEHMAEEGVLAHDIGTSSAQHRLENAGCDYGGENVAHSWAFERVETEEGNIRTSDEERLAETLVISWMNSQGHRDAILDEEYSKTGIGVAIAEDDAAYAAQKFCA